MPERYKVVCIPCKALYKCPAFTFTLNELRKKSSFIFEPEYSRIFILNKIKMLISVSLYHADFIPA